MDGRLHQSGCAPRQKKTVETIITQNNDYVITVKGNQPKLRSSLESAFKEIPAWSVERQHQIAHGRDIERLISVLPPPDDIDPEWVGVKRVIQVERFGRRGKLPFQETMYYLSSLERNAAEFAALIRHHWHVENRLHWPKDVVLKEDTTATCAGYAITGFAILRTMVVNLLRANGYASITEALDQIAHDINTLFSFLN